MNELILLLIKPRLAWSRLASKEEEDIKRRLLLLLVLAAIPPTGFYIGVTEVGWSVSSDNTVHVTSASAIPLAVLFYIALVASMVVIGLMAHWMSQTYDADSFPIKGIVFAGYASFPIFLAGVFAFYPLWWLDIIIATLAGCYAIRLIYLGIPPMMKVPEDRGMLFASALFAVALVYVVVVLVATVILWEYVNTPVFSDV